MINEAKKEAEKEQRLKEKEAAEKAKAEAAELFKPIQVQKVPFGVDPKTVLCMFFKKGHCEKGRKCKFSHDLDIERKGPEPVHQACPQAAGRVLAEDYGNTISKDSPLGRPVVPAINVRRTPVPLIE